MATFLMFGKYSARALQEMSIQRTDKVVDLIKQFGGTVQAMYATLGQQDLVLVVSLPGTEEAMKASVAITKLTGISFSTMPAVTVQDFDRLMSGI
jgi:uncharacterized protein with GYD domain